MNEVEKNFSQWSNVKLIQGRAPEVLHNIIKENFKISFLHVDLNFYEAEIQSLDFLWDYLSPNAFILLDDYANPGREVQYEAHSLFFKSKGENILL